MLTSMTKPSFEPTGARPQPTGAVLPLRHTATDDEQLLSGLVAKRPTAVADLYDKYADLVRGMLARTLNSSADADDLAQETFLIVVRKCHAVRDPSLLRSYIVSVAVRLARNELRKRRVRRLVGLPDTAEPALIVPPHDAEVAESVRALYRALDGLSADTRVAFVLRFVEGCTLDETAKACSCSLATVKRWLAKAEKCLSAAAQNDPLVASLFAPGRDAL